MILKQKENILFISNILYHICTSNRPHCFVKLTTVILEILMAEGISSPTILKLPKVRMPLASLPNGKIPLLDSEERNSLLQKF